LDPVFIHSISNRSEIWTDVASRFPSTLSPFASQQSDLEHQQHITRLLSALPQYDTVLVESIRVYLSHLLSCTGSATRWSDMLNSALPPTNLDPTIILSSLESELSRAGHRIQCQVNQFSMPVLLHALRWSHYSHAIDFDALKSIEAHLLCGSTNYRSDFNKNLKQTASILRVGLFSNRWAELSRQFVPILRQLQNLTCFNTSASCTIHIYCYTAINPLELSRQVYLPFLFTAIQRFLKLTLYF
jgi:hypothetical protein